jgi:hypothetical protein
LCKVVPNSDYQLCLQMISQYGPSIIAYVISELSPNYVCGSVLGLCKLDNACVF